MKRVDLELSEFTRRAGSISVAHSRVDLDRGLEAGERLLVRDGSARHWMATVQDISFDLTDTHYRLELGAEVDAYQAELLLAEATGAAACDLSDVLALLQDARQRVADHSYLAGVRHR